VLVRTGKYREDAVARSAVVPDLVVDDVTGLIDLQA
jgi:ribonucleotide monophosphatase NagD (HAD superfamily)